MASVSTMKIIAHRGASLEAPENTIPAILLAWQEKADGVEIDVRLTADGKVILLHDESTARTSRHAMYVAEQPWEALRGIDVGAWKSPRFRNTPIPLLRDVLKMVPSGRRLWVEIKCGEEILDPLKKELDVQRLPPQAIGFLGFSAHLMGVVKRTFPKHPVFWNVEPRGHEHAPHPWTPEQLIETVRNYSLDGLSVGYSDAVDDWFVKTVLDMGVDLMVWVVDDEHVATRLSRAGVPALMTNRPAYLRHRLHSCGVL